MLCTLHQIYNESGKGCEFFYNLQIFKSIAKQIPDEPSPETVQKAFDILCGAKFLRPFLATLHQIYRRQSLQKYVDATFGKIQKLG